jgi:hypothetical protein
MFYNLKRRLGLANSISPVALKITFLNGGRLSTETMSNQ